MVMPVQITTMAPNTEANIMFDVSPDQQVLPPCTRKCGPARRVFACRLDRPRTVAGLLQRNVLAGALRPLYDVGRC